MTAIQKGNKSNKQKQNTHENKTKNKKNESQKK